MTPDLEAAALFRQRAEELGLIARNAQDLDSRKALWDVAKDYERKSEKVKGEPSVSDKSKWLRDQQLIAAKVEHEQKNSSRRSVPLHLLQGRR